MKKLLALITLALPLLSLAQKDVTFIVDMRDYTGSYTTVNLNGDFNSWCGACNPMADPEGDSIWTVTLPLNVDSIEYKFTLDGWTGQESLTPGTICTKTTGVYTNRFAHLMIDTILPGVAWESCAAKTGQVYLTMQVNMEFQAVDSTGVFLAGGGVSGFGFPGDNEMHPIGDSVYSITLPRDTGFFSSFTFMNGNCPSWGCKENLAGKPCGDPSSYNDRSTGSVLYSDFHLMTCFGECTTDGTCPSPPTAVDVTFQSDRSNSPSFTTAYISGTMNNWSGNTNQMTDTDGDGVYEVTLSLLPGTYEYKYSADNWTIQENFNPSTADSACTLTTSVFTNRIITVGQSDTILPVQPWEDCASASGSTSSTSVNVNFSVNMNQVSSTFSNVYVSGTFDNWAGTSNQLLDSDGDGVYEGSVSLSSGYYEYKFLYDNWNGQEYFNSSTSDSLCTVMTGAYINRVMTIGASDTTLPTVCWEECIACGAGAYNNWYVTTTGSDQNSGSSASPFFTIQTAVDSAAPGDIIYVSSGTYSSFQIDKNVTLIGIGVTKPIIDGGDSTRCIEIINTKAKIQNLRLENGFAPQTYNSNRGACLYAQYDSVWIEKCDFYGGYASGGGDYYGGGGLPMFINCRFLDNTTASTPYLGAMFFVDNGQSANFYNCLIDAKGYQNIFEVGNTYRVYNSTIVNLEGQLYRSPWQNHEFIFVNNIVTELENNWEVFPDTSQGFWGNFEGEVVFKNNRLPELTNSYSYSQGGEVIVASCDTNDVTFIDSANGNYMLNTSSVHMNIGNLGIEFYQDVNGVNRPDINGRVDYGAYESDSRLISQGFYRLCVPGDSVLMWTDPIDSNSTGSILWSTGETSDSIYVSPLNTTTYTCAKTIDGQIRYDTTSVLVGGGGQVYSDSVLCFGSELSISIKGVDFDLPSDFLYVGTFEGNDIYFVQKSDTWNNQRAYASKYGGDLVVLDSKEKQDYVSSELFDLGLNNYNVWIGLYQNTQSISYSEPLGGWEWVNGQALAYSNWNSGEPNNSGYENFGELTQNGGWNDHFDWSKRAIVEIPVNQWDKVNWSTGDSSATISVSPLSDTLYYVTTSYKGVSCTDTARIYVNDARITASSPLVCVGDSISLSIPELSTSGQSKSVLWNTGESTSTIWVSQNSTTTYWVSVGLSDVGCSDTIEIVTTIPEPIISSSFTTNNTSTGVDLSSTPAATYLWSDSTQGSSINVYPSVTTDYWVKVTDTNACVGFDTLRVDVSDITFRVNMRTQIIDTTKGVHLAGNFQGWNPSSTAMHDNDGDGVYEVTLGLVSGDSSIVFKYINGDSWSDGHDDALDSCSNVSSGGDRTYIVPSVNDTLPLFHLSSCDEYMPINPLADAQPFICVGDTSFIDAGEGITEILWNTGDTSRIIGAVSPGWYWFEAKYPHQVRVYDSTYVNFYSYPDTSIAINGPTTFCDGDSVVLSLSSFVSPSWNNGSNLSVLPVTASGSYYATVLDTNGCSKYTDTIIVTVNPLPDTTLTISGNLDLCPGDTVTISAQPGMTDYYWSNGSYSSSIYVVQSDTLNVTLVNAQGCVDTSNTLITTLHPLPSVPAIIGTLTGVTPMQPYVYVVTQNAGSTYTWNITNGVIISGQGTSAVNVQWSQASNGSLTVTENNGYCEDSLSVSVSTTFNVSEAILNPAILFPNPTQGIFKIVLNYAEPVKVRMIDSKGNELSSFMRNSKELQLDATNYPAGVYQVILEFENEVQTLRVVVIR